MPATHRQLLLALSLLLAGLIFPASGATWAWQYDALGQLTNASREQDAAAVAGAQFAYSYDGIGNRLAASRGDTPDSATHAEQKTYTPNLLNQYTSRTQPGTVTVSGVANAAATVTVNGQPTQRGTGILPVEPPAPGTTAQLQSSFAATFSVANASGPAVFDATILATQNGVTEQEQRSTLVPPASEPSGYDADGNLTDDALWTYTWDAEPRRLAGAETDQAKPGPQGERAVRRCASQNRLTQMESQPTLPTSALRQRLTFAYDAGGRRIRKSVHAAAPDATAPGGYRWVLTTDRRFLYDGWNLIAEIDPDGTAYRTYLWGLDLSGSPQGAGGTHGLLAVFLRAAAPPPASGPLIEFPLEAHLCVYDGNGNLTSLVAASDLAATPSTPAMPAGAETARYTYDPFGSLLSATGPAALRNAIGFSTRYRDEESGLLYYGYRYYDPADGRWLNRDPIGERGGLNLYGMVGNDPVARYDILGLWTRPMRGATSRTQPPPCWPDFPRQPRGSRSLGVAI